MYPASTVATSFLIHALYCIAFLAIPLWGLRTYLLEVGATFAKGEQLSHHLPSSPMLCRSRTRSAAGEREALRVKYCTTGLGA